MQNMEFKAELRDLVAARAQCAQIAAQEIGTLRQTDTYFKLTDGRLKRREAPNEPIEWIYYHRPDRIGPRMSNYTILTDQQAGRRWGTQSLKPWLTVTKTRELWMREQVRIHLDQVDELGTFIEFEAMISLEFDARVCRAAVMDLRDRFGPILGEAISTSYCDLMDAHRQ